MGDLTSHDFSRTIQQVMYQMDYPVAGPGAFAQYMISEVASRHVKVVLGGQGGDEIFGGYARYLITYFEQCLKAAINHEPSSYQLPISPETMIQHLHVIKGYEPLMGQVWSKGLFGEFSSRYFAIINRSLDFEDELVPGAFNLEAALGKFTALFDNKTAFDKASYFDSMTRFDFSYLMPGLLHVEDRVSMAHGLEARVPFLDHPLVEFMATVPSRLKFKDGQMKGLMKQTFHTTLPRTILERKDKMGFPVPLTEWMKADLREFIFDTLHTGAARQRDFIDYKQVIKHCEGTGRYSRKLWAFLSYELWNQAFHDKKTQYSYQSEDVLVV
jgi:asparagine synthase (glutamine-hydrolysing)